MTEANKREIVSVSTALLGLQYTKSFRCTDFVRRVYRDALGTSMPPVSLNLSEEDLRAHRQTNCFQGYVLFLKKKGSSDERKWTHVAILFDRNHVVHNSWFFGKSVVVTEIDDILDLYELAKDGDP